MRTVVRLIAAAVVVAALVSGPIVGTVAAPDPDQTASRATISSLGIA